MEILKGFFKDLQSPQEYLNHTQIKSIQVCLDPEKLPNMVPIFKLNDLSHNCHITFSKETMNAIMEKSIEIKQCLRDNKEKLFLLNDELKVFSERMHNKCAVCFLNFQGVRINMMLDTFRELLIHSNNTFLKHSEIEHKLQKSAKSLKQLFDVLFAKFLECNINNPEYQSFLEELRQYVSPLSQGAPASNNANSNVVDITNDDEDENDYNEDLDEDEDGDEDEDMDEDDNEFDDEDEFYGGYPFGHRRRGYGWNHHW